MPINPITASTANNVQYNSTMGTGEINQEDFFSIMIDQLKNQNPLSPSDNSDFLNQMVQFSTMDQMKSIDERLAMSEALQLIGKTVLARSNEAAGGQVEGEVLSVILSGKEPLLEVNSEFISLENILLATSPEEIETVPETPPVEEGDEVL